MVGAFVSGVAFSQIDGAMELWEGQAPLSEWLKTIFLVSMGFQVLAKHMLQSDGLCCRLVAHDPRGHREVREWLVSAPEVDTCTGDRLGNGSAGGDWLC